VFAHEAVLVSERPKEKDAYRIQVDLLIRCHPAIAQAPEFAPKGGTAINLFHHNMPRLKALHIIADGPLFHVEIITARQGAQAALTTNTQPGFQVMPSKK
jgi:hypothetical protein